MKIVSISDEKFSGGNVAYSECSIQMWVKSWTLLWCENILANLNPTFLLSGCLGMKHRLWWSASLPTTIFSPMGIRILRFTIFESAIDWICKLKMRKKYTHIEKRVTVFPEREGLNIYIYIYRYVHQFNLIH